MEKRDFEELRYLLYSKKRSEGQQATFQELVDIMRTTSPNATVREIFETARKLNLFEYRTITPNLVLEFVRAVISKSGCKSLYVPFATGVELEELGTTVSSVDYTTPIREFRDLMQEKSGVAPISTNEVSPSEYDAVYSDILPYSPVRRDGIQDELVASIQRMKPNGLGVFVFANGIVYDKSRRSLISELSEKGIFAKAVIDLPEGSYLPATSVATKVILFSKEKPKEIFIAKLEREADVSEITNNFLSNSQSNKNELGVWVKFEANEGCLPNYRDSLRYLPNYTSFEIDERRKRKVLELRSAYGCNLIPFSEVIVDIRVLKRPEANFIEDGDAVYFPMLGKRPVETALRDLHEPQYYAQVIVNRKKVLPEFVKFFFNTDDGELIRIFATPPSSTFLNVKLNPERIKDIEIPVPSLKKQEDVMNVSDELDDILAITNQLKNRLKKTPNRYQTIRREIMDINNKGDRFEQWFETLPYPLATILKRYKASRTNQQKHDMLLYFFEAYSIFMAAILTTVYQQPQFRDPDLNDITANDFKQASFGNWVAMDTKLAKVFRKWLNEPDKINTVLNGFNTDDQSLVKLLTTKDVYSILDETTSFRNDKAHGGPKSEDDYKVILKDLTKKLIELMVLTDDLYEKIILIRPISFDNFKGRITNTVEKLTGSNPIFNIENFTGELLDRSELYIHVVDTNKNFSIPPFFVMKDYPTSIKNACYFYSRLSGSKTRYVSYHIESGPTEIEGEAAFNVIRSILEGSNDQNSF